MPRRLPPLNALRAFEAAGRFESFSRAADELGVSHSSVSRHVRGLEDRLGAKLFREASRGVALTSDGALYLSRIAPAFDLIAEATDDIAGRTATTISVNCEPVFAMRWLVHHLSAFHEQHPEIEVRLDASRHLVDIAHYEADIAIRYIQFTSTDASSVLISDSPVYAYAAPSLISEPVSDPATLMNYRILRDRGGDIVHDWFKEAGVQVTKIPANAWRMRASLAIEAAVSGYGVILASSDTVDLDVKAGRLIRLSDVSLKVGSYHMMFGEGAIRRKAVRQFRDWLLETTAHLRA